MDGWIYTKQNRIRNACIREKVGAMPIVEKMVNLALGGLDVCGEEL